MAMMLLLDLDGTLVDTLGFIIRCFQASIAPLVRQPPTAEEIVATFGPAEIDCIDRILQQYAARDLLQQPYSRMLAEAAAVQFHHLYAAGYAAGEVQPYPHMLDIVHEAKRVGWSVAIFTGKGRVSALATLEHLQLLPVLDSIITSDDVASPKPAPAGVLLACAQTKVPPSKTLFVGDNPADIQAGNAAGAISVAALWGAFDRVATLAAQPQHLCESPSDLRLLLQRVMM